MIKYPLTCVDNFFDNPASIVNYANSLSYTYDTEVMVTGLNSEMECEACSA